MFQQLFTVNMLFKLILFWKSESSLRVRVLEAEADQQRVGIRVIIWLKGQTMCVCVILTYITCKPQHTVLVGQKQSQSLN